jgi:hypothetical protein
MIVNRIKVFKIKLLSVLKEYGISIVSQLGTGRIKGVDLNCQFE